MIQTFRTEAGSAVDRRAPAHVRRAAWWAGKGFWAVLDQGIFASANFAVGILLARWLTPEQFGSFAVAHAVFLLAGTIHAGVISEPMLVFGSARHRTRFAGYFDILLSAHWRVAGLAGVVLAGVAAVCWLLGWMPLAAAFLGVAVATPFILFGWLVRRACFSCLQPQWAAAGSAVYLAVLLGGTYGVWRADLLTAMTALALMGGAGFVSGMWILGRLRQAVPHDGGPEPTRDEVFEEHWRYGRWAVASSGLSWIPGNVYAVLLPAFAGLEAAGALKALSNLVLPIMHANSALATLLIPSLGAVRDTPRFWRLLAGSLGAFIGAAAAYWLILTVFREPVVRWLYDGAYADLIPLVPLMALLPIGAACMAVLGSALRVMERPQHVFTAYGISVMVTLTAGLWLTAAHGLTGAIAGVLLSSLVTAGGCAVFLLSSVGKVSR